jgi:hypothetical protein
MKTLPARTVVPASAEVGALVQAIEASPAGARVPAFLLD